MSSAKNAPSPVSWQTLFWTLVPLATNIMTQPAGRVLSITGSYRIYLRSSPIISCLDAVAFILRVLLTSLLFSVSLHESLKITIRERYKEYEETDEGLRSLEKQTWLRWVFFIVGTLGPTVKLMALQGVPWTKAWGAMFLFAFLVIEVAALIARKSGALSVQTALPGIHHAQMAVQAPIAESFKTMERTVFGIGAVAHWAVLLWAFLDLWSLRDPAYYAYANGGPNTMYSAPITMFLIDVLIVCLFYMPYVIFYEFREDRGRDSVWKFFNSLIGVFLLILMGTAYYFLRHLPFYVFRDSALFSLTLSCIPAFVWAIKKLCGLSPRLAETLLITTAEEFLSVNGGAVWALTLCINNIAVSVLWYWLRYNPEGTVNLSWTAVFG